MELFDIDIISSIQNQLANLSGFYLSLYGEKGKLILPPVKENKIITALRSTQRGRDEYNEFVKKNLEIMFFRNEVSLFRDQFGIYHFFAPLRIDKITFTIVGGGLFIKAEDYEEFCKKDLQNYGIYPQILQFPDKQSFLRNREEILAHARHIRSIFNIVLRDNYRSNVNEKRYRLAKTILSLISDIKADKQKEEIYEILTDTMLFLFNVESLSIMHLDRNLFLPKKVVGRLGENIRNVSLEPAGIISEVIEKQKPVYTDNILDILKLGFGEKVTSIYIFPILQKEKVTALLIILNTEINSEDILIINEICKITGFIFRVIDLQLLCNKYLQEIKSFNAAAERLNPIREPEILYETILDTSVHLANAERGSLMLSEDNSSYLTIKAAKGINKRLLSEIKIKSGEGIAGWVFREGIPLRVEDIEKNETIMARKRPKYKTGSFISIPLRVGKNTIGVLNLSDKITGDVFSEEEMILIKSFASYASIALERSTFYNLVSHLRELSITDSLTGLFNRRYFEERFFEELHRSERHNLTFSLAMIDIDDFKVFNDSEGHLAGDEILKHIANIAKECLRVSDVIARFGGEEFTILMPQTDKDEAFLVAERIRQSIKEQIPKFWSSFPRDSVTVTIGISTYPYDGKEIKELIRSADKALYKGKLGGKDRTILWNSH